MGIQPVAVPLKASAETYGNEWMSAMALHHRTSGVVSVVMPAFNAEKFLREAVASVLAQTYASWELIIVDDGSSDNTLELARSISDVRVKVLTGPNRGPAHARNRAITEVATGDYIAFLDADDTWNEHKLAVQVDYLLQHPDIVAVGSFLRYISSEGKTLGIAGVGVNDAVHEQIRVGRFVPFPICSSLLVRREVIDVIGAFDSILRQAEDLDLLARLARVGRIGCIPEPLGGYRIHGDSASAASQQESRKYLRFISARVAARDEGRDLDWDEFSRSYKLSWRQQRTDFVQATYRAAALAFANRQGMRAAAYGCLAVLAGPVYSLRRAYRQRVAGLRR